MNHGVRCVIGLVSVAAASFVGVSGAEFSYTWTSATAGYTIPIAAVEWQVSRNVYQFDPNDKVRYNGFGTDYDPPLRLTKVELKVKAGTAGSYTLNVDRTTVIDPGPPIVYNDSYFDFVSTSARATVWDGVTIAEGSFFNSRSQMEDWDGNGWTCAPGSSATLNSDFGTLWSATGSTWSQTSQSILDHFTGDSTVIFYVKGTGTSGHQAGGPVTFAIYPAAGAQIEVTYWYVPEPVESAAMAGLGLIGFAGYRRIRKS